jgi:hypothetical protein
MSCYQDDRINHASPFVPQASWCRRNARSSTSAARITELERADLGARAEIIGSREIRVWRSVTSATRSAGPGYARVIESRWSLTAPETTASHLRTDPRQPDPVGLGGRDLLGPSGPDPPLPCELWLLSPGSGQLYHRAPAPRPTPRHARESVQPARVSRQRSYAHRQTERALRSRRAWRPSHRECLGPRLPVLVRAGFGAPRRLRFAFVPPEHGAQPLPVFPLGLGRSDPPRSWRTYLCSSGNSPRPSASVTLGWHRGAR